MEIWIGNIILKAEGYIRTTYIDIDILKDGVREKVAVGIKSTDLKAAIEALEITGPR